MHFESRFGLRPSESSGRLMVGSASAAGRRLRALGRPAAEVYVGFAGAKEEYESGWKMIAQSKSSRAGGGMRKTPLHWSSNAPNTSPLAECRIEAPRVSLEIEDSVRSNGRHLMPATQPETRQVNVDPHSQR